MEQNEIKEKLEQLITEQPILLFIKGNKMFPRCGFSQAVVEVFKDLDVPFEAVDIFDHPGIKPALISITDWPTTPQIFLGGEFVGGGDLVRALHANGDLKPTAEKVLSGNPS